MGISPSGQNLCGGNNNKCLYCSLDKKYRKIPKIRPRAYIFQRPFLRGLFLEGLMYGGKFAF